VREAAERTRAERDAAAAAAEREAAAYFSAVEALRLESANATALASRAAEVEARARAQGASAEVAKASRLRAARELEEARGDLATVRGSFRTLAARITALKETVTARDTALVKEHFEHNRVEKEAAALRAESARLAKQTAAADGVLSAQRSESGKLSAIAKEAEAEAKRQAAAVADVRGERTLLINQLVKRDAELTSL
jgi:hypothetical protein